MVVIFVVVLFFLYKAHFLLVHQCCGDCSPVESGQCLFFHSSIRFNSGWLVNVVGIVPQW